MSDSQVVGAKKCYTCEILLLWKEKKLGQLRVEEMRCIGPTHKIERAMVDGCFTRMFKKTQLHEMAWETVLCQKSAQGTRRRTQCPSKMRDTWANP